MNTPQKPESEEIHQQVTKVEKTNRIHILESDKCWCKPTITTTISKDGKERVTVTSHYDK